MSSETSSPAAVGPAERRRLRREAAGKTAGARSGDEEDAEPPSKRRLRKKETAPDDTQTDLELALFPDLRRTSAALGGNAPKEAARPASNGSRGSKAAVPGPAGPRRSDQRGRAVATVSRWLDLAAVDDDAGPGASPGDSAYEDTHELDTSSPGEVGSPWRNSPSFHRELDARRAKEEAKRTRDDQRQARWGRGSRSTRGAGAFGTGAPPYLPSSDGIDRISSSAASSFD
ncbi:hypothetical protein DFJ74DRAFT_644709 [Hyaloraphidium curvatum]|nr:hypothetical protein DFJ74DRAFT_644709 [Hyaloraphidium curvatum]